MFKLCSNNIQLLNNILPKKGEGAVDRNVSYFYIFLNTNKKQCITFYCARSDSLVHNSTARNQIIARLAHFVSSVLLHVG